MRFVVDTNQVLKLQPDRKITGPSQCAKRIVITPNVIGEMLLRGDPEPTLSHLLQFKVIYGLEPADSLRKVATSTEAEINRFQPFAYPEVSAPYREFYEALYRPAPEHLMWARKVKSGNRAFCNDMYSRAVRIRQIQTSQGGRDEKKYSNLEEARSALSTFFEGLVIASISHGGTRPVVITNHKTLFNLVMENQHLANLFKTLLFYAVSWARMWKDQRLNFDPIGSRDDWVDITLTLYASNGDFILTDDSKLRTAIGVVNPAGAVRSGLAEGF